MDAICDDLAAEHAALDAIVGNLPAAAWDHPTPAEGWAVRDQISHLWFYDEAACLAVTDPEAFARAGTEQAAGYGEGKDPSVVWGREVSPAELLEGWRAGRAALLATLRPLDPKTRIPWYGPPMGARSFATARLMETWAHGQDVADALGVEREPTERLRHIAHIGVLARPFAYATRGLDLPATDVRVVLAAPGGGTWAWGPETAFDSVEGSALDFCLVVTQRRHPADTGLVATGPAAAEWMSIAQCFAGPPGRGREPGQFARA